ncbi:MAG: YdcH family protein [Paracoccaceae bacterium]
MTHTPHDLAQDFPEYADKLHKMKTEDAHFAKLADAYHDLNRQVHRAETRVEPIDEAAEHALRRERATLKDEIYRMLAA